MRDLIEAVQSSLPRDKVDEIDDLAKRCVYTDTSNDIEPRPSWWVGEQSHKLGIVDGRGMIDVSGEIARVFKAAYRRWYLKTSDYRWKDEDFR